MTNSLSRLRSILEVRVKRPSTRTLVRNGFKRIVLINPNKEEKGRLLEDLVEEAYKLAHMPYTRNKINGLGVDFYGDAVCNEVKHWGCRLTRGRYLSEVAHRFTTSDPTHSKKWVLTSTAKLGKGIDRLLVKDRVEVIQLPHDIPLDAPLSTKRRFVGLIVKGLKRVYGLLEKSASDSESKVKSTGFSKQSSRPVGASDVRLPVGERAKGSESVFSEAKRSRVCMHGKGMF